MPYNFSGESLCYEWKYFLIYGNGLLASAFRNVFQGNQRYSIFAEGVSNSKENRPSEFLREKNKLLDCIDNGMQPVYFSSCSVYDKTLINSPYVTHKLEMESLCATAKSFLIFRLPQVVGLTSNPYTVTNYLFNKIKTSSSFELWKNATRVLIDVDDVVSIVNHIIEFETIDREIINITHDFPMPVLKIVEIFESLLMIKGNYKVIDAGGTFVIDGMVASDVAKKLGISFDSDYSEKLLYKYYGS